MATTFERTEPIELTPTWTAVLPLLLAAIKCGTDESERIAKKELARMAQAADLYNEMDKGAE